MPSSGSGSEGSETTVASSGGGTGGLKKGPWTAAEDAILLEYVKNHGEGNWNSVQRNSGLSRCGKSCRLRWANHLRPNLKKGSFTPEEERLILELHSKMGNKWARMAAQMPGRTDNEIKNYWNTRIKRRQRAGLPLYPPDIHRATNANPPSPDAQFAASKNATPSSLNRVPFNFSLMPASNATAVFGVTRPATFLLPEDQLKLKRLREESMVDHAAPFLARPLQVAPHLQYCNHDMGLPLLPFSMKMELPSSQSYVLTPSDSIPDGAVEWSRSNSGLLDALLSCSGNQGKTQASDSATEKGNWVEGHGRRANAELQGTPASEVPTSWETPSTENKMEKQDLERVESGGNELSALLDMLPVEPIRMSLAGDGNISDWYSGDSSGELSSNAQSSSAMTGEDMLEMQKLASSITMSGEDNKWSSGSLHWSNSPGIC